MDLHNKKSYFMLGLIILAVSTLIIPGFIFSIHSNSDTNSVILPVWLIGMLAGLGYALLGISQETSQRLAMGIGSLLLLVLKLLNPLGRYFSGSWNLQGYIPGMPYFGDACSLFLGFFTALSISGIVSLAVKRDFNLKTFIRDALLWMIAVPIIGIVDGLSCKFSQAVTSNGALYLHLLAVAMQLILGVAVGVLIFRKLIIRRNVRAAVILLGSIALARMVLGLFVDLGGISAPGDLLNIIFRLAMTSNFYQSAAVNGILFAAAAVCIKQAKTYQQAEQPVPAVI